MCSVVCNMMCIARRAFGKRFVPDGPPVLGRARERWADIVVPRLVAQYAGLDQLVHLGRDAKRFAEVYYPKSFSSATTHLQCFLERWYVHIQETCRYELQRGRNVGKHSDVRESNRRISLPLRDRSQARSRSTYSIPEIRCALAQTTSSDESIGSFRDVKGEGEI